MPLPPVCRTVRGGLTDYLEEALPLAERQGYEAHLSTCPTCRRAADEMRCTRAALASLPRRPMPAEMKRRLLHGFRARGAAPGPHPARPDAPPSPTRERGE